jgi:hypothetical protein
MKLLLLIIAALNHPHVHSGTLIIIAKSADAIVIAADSSVTTSRGEVGAAQGKIFPGRVAACAMVGAVMVESNSGKGDLNFPKLVRSWIEKHPNAMVKETQTSIAAEMHDALKKFFGAEPDRANVSLVCVGYENGVPRILNTDFLIVGTEVQKTERDYPLGTGIFMALGWGDVSRALTGGNAPIALNKFSSAPSVKKYRTTPAQMTTKDFIDLARTCEEATESPEARTFDPHAFQVVGPNRFATITGQHGFKWLP